MSVSASAAESQARKALRQGNPALAERFFLKALAETPDRTSVRAELARLFLGAGHFEPAMVQAQEILNRRPEDVEGWRLAGLAFLGNQQYAEADQALAQAHRLSPTSSAVRFALAQLALERGNPAGCLSLLEPAPAQGASAVMLRARALQEVGEPQAAQQVLTTYLTAHPKAASVHALLARLGYLTGQNNWLVPLAEALAAYPDDVSLRLTLAGAQRGAGALEDAISTLRGSPVPPCPELLLMLADCELEQGAPTAALAAADQARQLAPRRCALSTQRIDALLGLGRFEEARGVLAELLGQAPLDQRYLARYVTVLRALGDAQADGLFATDRLVHVVDDVGLAWLPQLAEELEVEHRRSGPPLDQSLRGGTQTARSLLTLDQPAVRKLLRELADATGTWVRELPRVSGHPFDGRLAGGAPHLRGCWSVKLKSGGRHVDHVHSQGVVSAVYYVSVPPACHGPDHAGWLRFGQPRFAVPGVEAALHLEPRPGRLVLFPSYFWHGTEPFSDTHSRLTVAFDTTFS